MRLGSVIAAIVLLTPLTAAANEHIDAGVAALEEGEFEAAIASFAAAEDGELTREDLVRLFTHRALAQHALGEDRAMETDLLRLASIEPAGELPRSAPPQVRDAFEAARDRAMGGLAIEIRQEREGARVELTARVLHDVGALVTSITMSARPVGAEGWVDADPNRLSLEVPDGAEVEVHARAVGPGGAVLLERGTLRAPEVLVIGEDRAEAEAEEAVADSLGEEDSGSDDVAIGVGVGVSVALVLGGAAAILVYFLMNDTQRTEIAPPVAVFWP